MNKNVLSSMSLDFTLLINQYGANDLKCEFNEKFVFHSISMTALL